MKLICFFFGHKWSDWERYIMGDRDYKYCIRCGKQVVEKR